MIESCKVHTIGNYKQFAKRDKSMSTVEEAFLVNSVCGKLEVMERTISKDYEYIVGGSFFEKENDDFSSMVAQAKKDLQTMGIVTNHLKCNWMPTFFEKQEIYSKFLVKLDKDTTCGDSVTFQVCNRTYNLFVREIVPSGTEWLAIAFAIAPKQPETRIIECTSASTPTFKKPRVV